MLLAGVFVFRIAYALIFERVFDLAGDEAYYWDWGRRLAWGYYSKPPMIGWLMGLAGRLSGNQEWAIRLAPLLLGTGSLVALRGLAGAMFDARTAFFAVLFVVLTPGNAALNLLFTIDAPLVLAWTLALLFFWRAVEQPARWGWWLLLAAAIGFGSLSKQMMLVFPLLMVIFAAVSPADRRLMRNARMWACIVVGAASLIPVLIWQQANGWPTLSHMKEHFEVDGEPDGSGPGILKHAGWFLQFPAIQAALYSPVMWVVVMAALVVALQGWRHLERRGVLLVVFSAPALVVFFILALRQEVHPNWPAVYYVSAFVLAAAWIHGAVGGMSPGGKWCVWARRGLWAGLVMVIIAYVYPIVSGPLGLAGDAKLDPFERLRGWKEAGERAGEFLKMVPEPDETFVVVLGHRNYASEMAFYMPQQPRVYRWQQDGRLVSQYEIWPAPDETMRGWNALVISPDSEEKDYKKLSLNFFFWHSFRETTKLGDISVPVGGNVRRSYQVFLCSFMKKWPEPAAVQVEKDPNLKSHLDPRERVP